MYNDNDESYYADVYIGNPKQKMRALFDTGSSNTWVLSTKASNGMAAFAETESTTSKATTQGAQITFGSGTLGGFFFIDDFTVG